MLSNMYTLEQEIKRTVELQGKAGAVPVCTRRAWGSGRTMDKAMVAVGDSFVVIGHALQSRAHPTR